MSNPKISVLMATYNRSHLIGEAIQSIQGQSYSNFELIIIDDQSTDRTKDIVDSFISKDHRISYYRPDKKLGCYAARNYGLSKSKGEYIAIADDDDICLPDRLLKQKEMLDTNPDVAMTFSDVLFIDSKESKKIWPNKPNLNVLSTDDLFKQLFIFGICIPDPSVVFRRSALSEIKGYPYVVSNGSPVSFWGDWVLFMQMAVNDYKFKYLNDVLVHMNKKADHLSMTSKKTQRLIGATESIRFMIEWLERNHIQKYDHFRAMVFYRAVFRELQSFGFSKRIIRLAATGLILLPSAYKSLGFLGRHLFRKLFYLQK